MQQRLGTTTSQQTAAPPRPPDGTFSCANAARKALDRLLVGQPAVAPAVLPLLTMYDAYLLPPRHPAGAFLLLGPTGTGKTRTVEILAYALHGHEQSMIRVDCGEFQMEHEIAKFLGSPPGYLGHKETKPILTQAALNGVVGKDCGLSLILFDEVEKAHDAVNKVLLGILDHATLRLGDNTTVNFEQSLIFFTSNLGARDMVEEVQRRWGFERSGTGNAADQIRRIGEEAARKKFPPEFMNRIDQVIVYQPLDDAALEQILEIHINEAANMVLSRCNVGLKVLPAARKHLLRHRANIRQGARQIRRIVRSEILQPLAGLIAERTVLGTEIAAVDMEGGRLVFRHGGHIEAINE